MFCDTASLLIFRSLAACPMSASLANINAESVSNVLATQGESGKYITKVPKPVLECRQHVISYKSEVIIFEAPTLLYYNSVQCCKTTYPKPRVGISYPVLSFSVLGASVEEVDGAVESDLHGCRLRLAVASATLVKGAANNVHPTSMLPYLLKVSRLSSSSSCKNEIEHSKN
jgi:hypothetical protein